MNEKRPLFLFIESNTSGTGQIFARRSHELGFTPVLISSDPLKYSYVEDPWLRHERCDTYNASALEKLARRLQKDTPIAGVFSSSEYFISHAAKLARALERPGPDGDKVEACRDKSIQRRVVSEHGIDDLRFALTQTADDVAEQAALFGGPVVVKPVRGSGSSGVQLCRTVAEARKHADHLFKIMPGMPILVEDFAPGSEFSVELFDGMARGIVSKKLGAQPHFVEYGHDYPARIEPQLAQTVKHFAQECAAALGITWGPAHVEVRTDGTRVHLVEVNPRLAGGFIPVMIHAASGQDLIGATIQRATDQDVQLGEPTPGCAALRFLVPNENGFLQELSGLDAARQVSGIAFAESNRQLPQDFRVHHDFRDRVGHIMALHPDQTAAVNAAEQAMSLVSFRFAEKSLSGAPFKEEEKS